MILIKGIKFDYPYWRVRVAGKQQYYNLHRLVWETLRGPIPKGMQVHHIDGNKVNNDISNLTLLPIGAHQALHMKGKPKSEEWKANMSKNWHKIYGTPERMAKVSVSMRKMWEKRSPEERQRITSVGLNTIKENKQ